MENKDYSTGKMWSKYPLQMANLQARYHGLHPAAMPEADYMKRLHCMAVVALRLRELDTTPAGNLSRSFVYNSRLNTLAPTGEHLIRAMPRTAQHPPEMTLATARVVCATQGLPVPLAVYQRGVYWYRDPEEIAAEVAQWAEVWNQFKQDWPCFF